jgi:hypothetical protein
LLGDETPQSSDARNKVFELVMAGRLREAGFKPRFVEPADAVVAVDGIICSLECKRIQSEDGLKDAVARGYSQIKERIKGSLANTRGLFAVDISKVINPTGNGISAPILPTIWRRLSRNRSSILLKRTGKSSAKIFIPLSRPSLSTYARQL